MLFVVVICCRVLSFAVDGWLVFVVLMCLLLLVVCLFVVVYGCCVLYCLCMCAVTC